MNLNQIQMMPTLMDKVHESCFQSFHILNFVLIMVERGDSKETILELVEMLRNIDCNPNAENGNKSA